MAFLKIKNRAFSTLASGVSDSDTSWTVATGEGAKFPTTGDFHITCEDEIVKCTSRSTDVLTVVRAQEGTSAAAHTSGKAVELRVTAGVLDQIESDFLSHAARHKWLGSDEITIPYLFLSQMQKLAMAQWVDSDGWTDYTSGAGAAVARSFNYCLVKPMATNGAIACTYPTNTIYTNVSGAQFPLITNIDMVNITSSLAWMGFFPNTPDTAPSNTDNHMGWKIVNGRVYASCGNGTNGTQVDTGVDLGDVILRNLIMVPWNDGGTNKIDYYIDGTLEATITTNLPSNGPKYLLLYAKNVTSAENISLDMFDVIIYGNKP